MKLYKKYLTEARRGAPKFKTPKEIGIDTYLEWGTTTDGWDDKQIDADTGLMQWLEDIAELSYELKSARRDSYAKFGGEPGDLQRHITRLSKDLSAIARRMKGYIK